MRRIRTGAIGHGVPVTPDERAPSSWSFLTKCFSSVPFTRFFEVLSLAVVPRDEGPDFAGPSYVLGPVWPVLQHPFDPSQTRLIGSA
jgi:hypothetical protein